jgi:hypothetical protein
MKRAGIADVDVHIHHDGEGQQNFVDRMSGFSETLVTRHGLLRLSHGRPVFGFIHGNWALDNSRPDGVFARYREDVSLRRPEVRIHDLNVWLGEPASGHGFKE